MIRLPMKNITTGIDARMPNDFKYVLAPLLGHEDKYLLLDRTPKTNARDIPTVLIIIPVSYGNDTLAAINPAYIRKSSIEAENVIVFIRKPPKNGLMINHSRRYRF